MRPETHLGRNKTGVQMSPLQTTDMERGQEEIAPLPTPEMRGDLIVRAEYASPADGLGSVPPPGTVKGLLATGLDMLTGKRPQSLIDRLGERLAFERGGVRLYDSLLVKCAAGEHGLDTMELQTLRSFREEEARHFALVADALRRLGADPTAQTPCADLVGVESLGLVQAMNDPRSSVLQGLHVMLDAELIDNTGWELLIELCEATGHTQIAADFRQAAATEALHLEHLKRLVARLSLEDAGRDGDDSGIAAGAGASGAGAAPLHSGPVA
jgi:rubrerythrin